MIVLSVAVLLGFGELEAQEIGDRVRVRLLPAEVGKWPWPARSLVIGTLEATTDSAITIGYPTHEIIIPRELIDEIATSRGRSWAASALRLAPFTIALGAAAAWFEAPGTDLERVAIGVSAGVLTAVLGGLLFPKEHWEASD